MRWIDLYGAIALNAFAIVAVHFVFGTGQLLGILGGTIRAKLGPYWSKPVTECRPCMASVWGTAFYWSIGFILMPVDLATRAMIYPVYILALSGIMVILAEIKS